MFSTSTSNHKNNNNSIQSTFYYQPSIQSLPTRRAPPVPLPTSAPPPTVNATLQRPLTLKTLNLNPINQPNEIVTDLLDLGDPGSPPPSPKFDPYG